MINDTAGHIHECAEKAWRALDTEGLNTRPDKEAITIICEAFGLPKDECEEAFKIEFPMATSYPHAERVALFTGFKAAWKLKEQK